MTAQTIQDNRWTVAWRKPRANCFVRADDVAVSWREAHDLAGRIAEAHPELSVWYTITRAAEDDGYAVPEDRGNILADSGMRVRVVEGGSAAALLPATVVVTVTEQI